MMDRSERAFIAVLALITVVYLVLFGYYLGAMGLRVPVVDVIYWVLHYMDYWLTGDWWGYLWQPHNEHRMIWARLLTFVDIEWFHGTTMPFLLFSLACLAMMVGLILREVMASGLEAGPRATIVLLVMLPIFASYNAIAASIGLTAPSPRNSLHDRGYELLVHP